MKIMMSKRIINRFEDGISEILKSSDEDFEAFLSDMNPKQKIPQNIDFCYIDDRNPDIILKDVMVDREKRRYSINEVLTTFAEKITNYQEDSREYKRIKKLLNVRNFDGFKEIMIDSGK